MSEQVFTQCTSGGPVMVHVKDGEITRIRPIVFDETDPQPWVIEAQGKKFSPPRKTTMMPYIITEMARVIGEKNKIPLKKGGF